MAIVNAQELPDGVEIENDICIIGAGASGITLATQLEDYGIGCCLLEGGDLQPDEATQSLHDVDNIGYPLRENFMSRIRHFGGSCNIWAGRAMRLCPMDFERRDWIPDSGWPISYSEMEPYYVRAEKLLKLPSFIPSNAAASFKASSVDEQRLLSSSDIVSTLAFWGVKPLRFGKVFRRRIRRSKLLTLYLNTNVTELIAAGNGASVTALVARTLDGKRSSFRAKTFVLATGGLENARLLLNSRGQSENGIGNQYDLVGRYYLDHPRAIFGSVNVNESVQLPALTGLPLADGKIQFGLAMSEDVQRRHGVVNSYASFEPQMSEFAERQYGRTINVAKVLLRRGHAGGRFDFSPTNANKIRDMIYLLTPKEIMPHFIYRPYAMLKRMVRRRRKLSKLTIINFCEQSPNPGSRVTLSDKSDRLGVPMLKLDWRIGDDVRRSIRYLHESLQKSIAKAGIGTFIPGKGSIDQLQFTDASHHMGTTRMSSTNRTGVVDADCKVHGLQNLYISSSSVFPTVGHANPTLTIVALAIRLAEHIRNRQQ